jgi:hypothetical protein
MNFDRKGTITMEDLRELNFENLITVRVHNVDHEVKSKCLQ